MDQEGVDDGKAPVCTGLGGNRCPVEVLGALGMQVEGGDRAKAKLTEPKEAENSQWRGGRRSPAACRACGKFAGRPSAGTLGMERGSTSPQLLPAHSLPPGRVYIPRHIQSLGGLLWMRTGTAVLGSSLQLLVRFSFFPSPDTGFSYPWEINVKLIPGARLRASLHTPLIPPRSRAALPWWNQLKYLQRS